MTQFSKAKKLGEEKIFQAEKTGLNGHLGLKFEKYEPGHVVCSLIIEDKHKNPAGTLHGGAICTLLDTAAGASGIIKEDGIRSLVTQAADIHFLRAVSSGKITAEGTVIKDGKQTAVARGDLFDENGNLIATGTFDLFYLDKKAEERR